MERYDPIRILGEGSFGKVYLMRDKVKRTFVCTKIIKIKNIPKKEREATKMEVDLLRRLHHPNIVRYVDSFLSKNQESLCIVMEYCDGGDLAGQIKAARRNMFSESKILHWFVQIALGLHYMHSNKVLHRDLKTQNIFLLGNGRLVLGDLGISKVLDGTMDFAQTCIGTPYYMSPEIFKNKPYSYKSDVWALGCVLYEMTTLEHAFDAQSLNGLAQKIIKGRYPPIHSKYSKHLGQLINDMLFTNPQQRPDLDQILRRPFVKKHVINFFSDIAVRPSANIGEGTMIVRAAVGVSSNSALNNDSNMLALKKQLQELDMTEAVNEVLSPKGPIVAPKDPLEAKKLAKEQLAQLKREEDHKKMVEAAIEKLRLEREQRSKDRAAGKPNNEPPASSRRDDRSEVGAARGFREEVRQGGGLGAGLPPSGARAQQPIGAYVSNANGQNGPKVGQPSVDPKAPQAINRAPVSDPYQRPIRNESPVLGANANANANPNIANRNVQNPPVVINDNRRRSFGDEEKRRADEKKKLQMEQEARDRAEEKRREDVRLEAKAREDSRLKEEARIRDEAAAKQRQDQLKVQADAAARRDAHRDRERQRQKEEIEQLKKDKLELDRRTNERDRWREDQRAGERRKLEERKLDAPDSGQAKMSGRDSYLDRNQDPYTPRSGGGGVGAAANGNRAEEKSELSTKDRVLQRKMEKQVRDEQERLEALREAEAENRRIRYQASNQNFNIYHNSNVPVSGGVSAAPPKREEERGYEYEPSIAAGRGGVGGGIQVGGGQRNDDRNNPSFPYSNSNNEPNSGKAGINRQAVDLAELSDKLNEATKGKQSRYSSNSGDEKGQPSSYNASRAQQPRNNILKEDVLSDDEDESNVWSRQNGGNAEDEDEDMLAREEELKAELTMATMRCDELKKTLEVTKSFIGDIKGKDDRPIGIADRAQGVSKHRPPPIIANESDTDGDFDDVSVGSVDDMEDSWGPSNIKPPRQIKTQDDSTMVTPRKVREPLDAVKESPYYNLQDPPTPSGRLSDRIELLKQRCIEALGRDAFRDAYTYLKQSNNYDLSDNRGLYEDDLEEEKMARIRSILGEGKAHYMSLIEQLIFMEDTHVN